MLDRFTDLHKFDAVGTETSGKPGLHQRKHPVQALDEAYAGGAKVEPQSDPGCARRRKLASSFFYYTAGQRAFAFAAAESRPNGKPRYLRDLGPVGNQFVDDIEVNAAVAKTLELQRFAWGIRIHLDEPHATGKAFAGLVQQKAVKRMTIV